MKYILAVILSLILLSTRAAEPSFMNKSPREGLWEALEYYDIHHREIVYAQAILETGHFTSGGCKRGHNLFGLRDKHYHAYNHWSESVVAYKNKIQSRYKPGEDYYKFLERIHYASDPNYTRLLKAIVRMKYWKNE